MSIFGQFSENFGLFRFVAKQFCLFRLFWYRFETPKQTEFFYFWFHETNQNKRETDLFRFEPKFIFVCFEDTLVGTFVKRFFLYCFDITTAMCMAYAEESGFINYGSTFRPNPDLFPGFLHGPTPPLCWASSSTGATPHPWRTSEGLNSLSYEFYKSTFGFVAPAFLDGLITILSRGLLCPSLCHGVVRLLPKSLGCP